MYIHGSFCSMLGELIEVHIVTQNDRTEVIEVSHTSERLQFPSNSPVVITSEVNDTLDTLLHHSATIRLLTRGFIPELFGASPRDVVVNIYKSGACVFAGYIEPQSYSQPFNELWDEIELNCIDALSVMQYRWYLNADDKAARDYIRSEADQRTFLDILTPLLQQAASGLDLKGGNALRVLYDGSKALNAAAQNKYTLLSQIALNELLLLGEEEGDTWTHQEVVTELLGYLDLRIVQEGLTFYIFSWESVKASAPITWRDLVTSQSTTDYRGTIAIDNDNAADTNTSLSVGEVYSVVTLAAEVEEMNTIVENPLDSKNLKSPFVNKQKYMTELSVQGDRFPDYEAFYQLCKEGYSQSERAKITDWYVQVMQSRAWKFPRFGLASGERVRLDASHTTNNARNQHREFDGLATGAVGAIIAAVGSIERTANQQDNSVQATPSLTNTLIIAVNGNGRALNDPMLMPNEAWLKAGAPVAEYQSRRAGGVFSPADDQTTNYFVISGKLLLNPRVVLSGTKEGVIRDYEALPNDAKRMGHHTKLKLNAPLVQQDKAGNGKFYTRGYWQAEHPNDQPSPHELGEVGGFAPYTANDAETFVFRYSAVGDNTDKVSKVGVLACMLIVGNKCVVERGQNGQIGDYVWQPYKTREQCISDDEYFQQSFTIGFDPKIGDKLVGVEYDIQNNIPHTLNIEAEGTAIPIRATDRLSGRVEFKILGPTNVIWDDITRRHPTFFRRTKWTTNAVPLLAHVSNIQIKAFELKVYSDKGLVNNTEEGDTILYTSNASGSFKNAKALEGKITTALTTEEAAQLGGSGIPALSAPHNTLTDEPLLTIYDHNTQQQDKPEQLRVDNCYLEYSTPRVIVEQALIDTPENVQRLARYQHPALTQTLFVQGISRRLADDEAILTLKTI